MRRTGTLIIFLSFVLTACGSRAATSGRDEAVTYNKSANISISAEAPEAQAVDAKSAASSSNSAATAAPDRRTNVGRAVLRQSQLNQADAVADTEYTTDR
jgi:hypothetical protein